MAPLLVKDHDVRLHQSDIDTLADPAPLEAGTYLFQIRFIAIIDKERWRGLAGNRKLQGTLLFFLIALPAFGQEAGKLRVAPAPCFRSGDGCLKQFTDAGRASAPFTAGSAQQFRLRRPAERLFAPFEVSGVQTTTLSPPQQSGVTAKERPHLIELTSANWRPLTRSEKFGFFEYDLLHWETHVSLLLDAGISSALGNQPYLGDGAAHYFRTYGLDVADEADFTFFNSFLFPTLFHQDPRYIPLDHHSTGRRLAYAISRVLMTRGDSGMPEINKSVILGTIVATSLSSAYYSAAGADVSLGGNFASIGINLGSDAAFDVLKEFWPDVARKLNLNVWIRNLVRGAIRDRIRIN